MKSFKRLLVIAALVGGAGLATAPQADAGIVFRRVAPVRRAVLPPYPVARAVARPVYRPYYRPYYSGYRGYGPGYYGGPGFYGGPGYYGPGISVGFGVY